MITLASDHKSRGPENLVVQMGTYATYAKAPRKYDELHLNEWADSLGKRVGGMIKEK